MHMRRRAKEALPFGGSMVFWNCSWTKVQPNIVNNWQPTLACVRQSWMIIDFFKNTYCDVSPYAHDTRIKRDWHEFEARS